MIETKSTLFENAIYVYNTITTLIIYNSKNERNPFFLMQILESWF